MKQRTGTIFLISVFCFGGGLLAFQREAAGQHSSAQDQAETKDTIESLPKPKFSNLRYDEDFSYVDGEPGTVQEDFFDPLKNIDLGDDWRLSIGGEFRYRLKAQTNKAFGAAKPAQDTFNLFRYLVHLDLKYRDPFGNSGTEIGHELDVTPAYKLDLHSSLLLGYSHFLAERFHSANRKQRGCRSVLRSICVQVLNEVGWASPTLLRELTAAR